MNHLVWWLFSVGFFPIITLIGELFQNAEALLDKLLSLGIGISEVPSGVESHEELEPGSSASVAQQRQPEATTSCASSSEQATVVNSVEQGIVFVFKGRDHYMLFFLFENGFCGLCFNLQWGLETERRVDAENYYAHNSVAGIFFVSTSLHLLFLLDLLH